MITWPGPLAIAAVLAIAIFFVMRNATRSRRERQSERLQRHREYYDTLMERHKKKEEDDKNTDA